MKTIGIIGGLGPETTAKFYLEIISKSFETNKLSRPPILMYSVPLEYEVERELIEESKNEERYIPYLVDAAKRLEAGGADFIVIPCNSVHIFIKEVRGSVKIPVLSIVEETENFLKKENISKVGLLATSTTIKHRLYNDVFEKSDIETTLPADSDQESLGEIIERLVMNNTNYEDKDKLFEILGKFENVDTILLACTDLQLAIKDYKDKKVYDTMKILADSTVSLLQEK